MKAILLSFLCLSTLASTGISVKVSDGTVATCKTKSDVHRFKFGAYKAALKEIAVNSDVASFDLKIDFLSCQNKDGDINFSSVKPLDGFNYQSVSFEKGIIDVEVQPESVKMISYRDGVYKIISDVELSNDEQQIVKLDIKVEDLLSSTEIENLRNGQEVIGNFDYMLQKSVVINGSSAAEKINFGAFRIHFKAKVDKSGNIEIVKL